MKQLILSLSLLGCACAPAVLSLSRSGAAPAPAGSVRVIGRYGPEISAGSVWIDRAGAIYLTDRSRWRVLSYQPDGDSCLVRFEQGLDNPGMFLVPGYDEGFCLADNLGRRIVFYSSQGRLMGTIAVAAGTISAAALSAAGDVFVADDPQRMITVYDSRGALLRRFSVPGAARGSIGVMAVTRAGDVFALADAADGMVTLYSAFGRRLGRHRIRPVAMAFDSYDRLWSLDGEGCISVHRGPRPDGESVWPDSAPILGSSAVLAVGNGDVVVVAARSFFHMCK